MAATHTTHTNQPFFPANQEIKWPMAASSGSRPTTREMYDASIAAGVGVESLRDAVAEIFCKVASGSNYGAASTPSSRQGDGFHSGPQIKTAGDWKVFMDEVAAAGLLPQDELLQVSREMSLPATLQSFHNKLEKMFMPPRVDKVEVMHEDMVNRAEHLTRQFKHWDIDDFSPKQTAKALGFVDELRHRLTESTGVLADHHARTNAKLGPERVQSLFWDLVDPAAKQVMGEESRLSPHLWQKLHREQVERRCDQLRVRTTILRKPEAKPHDPPRVDVSIGVAADNPSLKLRVIRAPYQLAWSETCLVLAYVDAVRQMVLSRHAPAFLGRLPVVQHDPRTGWPQHSRWHIELVNGAPLEEGVLAGGRLHESSLLFRHWRRELVEALHDVSNMTTFLLPHSVNLSHVLCADEGCRLVLDDLAWGAEFPLFEWWEHAEFAAAHRDEYDMYKMGEHEEAFWGHAEAEAEECHARQPMRAPEEVAAWEAKKAARAEGQRARREAMAAEREGRKRRVPLGEYARVMNMDHRERAYDAVDLAALRDTTLLFDACAMLMALLTGKLPSDDGMYEWRPTRTPPLEPPAVDSDAWDDYAPPPPKPRPSAWLAGEGVEVSAHLAAILDACADPYKPPTLKEVLSHPYFAEPEGFEREDVRAAYRRWRSGADKRPDAPSGAVDVSPAGS